MTYQTILKEHHRHSKLLILAIQEQNYTEQTRILNTYFILQAEILKHNEIIIEAANAKVKEAKKMIKQREYSNCLRLLK